ncbi:uncharacterized protein LOC124404710 [Diprion similis]|uniref:uncharacterized protein LOC124404710 n=1 Tax=Diprion similis TaxID=362088 RepID=UPI001EF7DA2F|nr:uncharacterized protein LOC124404710 [Diprion similis]
MENAGWLDVEEKKKLTDAEGNFDVLIPLSTILGFAEDYRKIVVNAKHELILTRSKSEKKVDLLNFIEKDPPISMSFRSWELYEYPLLPITSKHVWTVKTSTQLENPRYVILAFQTSRKNKIGKNVSHFDHCNVTDVKLFLNSQYYPYGNLNLNMSRNLYALLYEMYANFQATYYKNPEALLTRSEFLQKAPLFVIDCSKQNESLKYGPVDIRLEFEANANFLAETSAYCLIVHDRIVEYNPLSGGVKKLV